MRAARFLFLLVLSFSVRGEDSSVEKRTAALAQELRCLVCQNQTLADSNAPLAVDLRNQIREQLASGKSERDVKEYMVARYGDFVLYRPPFNAATAVLWAGPFLLLLGGFFLLFRSLRRKPEAPPELSGPERERAAKLLQ